MTEIHDLQLAPVVERALQEERVSGDWATDLCVPADARTVAWIRAREGTLIAGTAVVRAVFQQIDPDLRVRVLLNDGNYAESGQKLIALEGRTRSILRGERVSLNFLGRMCGIAELTRQFVDRLAGLRAQLLDTRQSTPGLRMLEKAAVFFGGGRSHRFCLTDSVLIRASHIQAAGSITSAVNHLLESLPPTLKIEVGACNITEVHEALEAGANLISLSGMSLPEMALAVRTVQGKAFLEASGHVTLENVRMVAETGVDFISASAILSSARWSDLRLTIDDNI